jgi:hypothetical protein
LAKGNGAVDVFGIEIADAVEGRQPEGMVAELAEGFPGKPRTEIELNKVKPDAVDELVDPES